MGRRKVDPDSYYRLTLRMDRQSECIVNYLASKMGLNKTQFMRKLINDHVRADYDDPQDCLNEAVKADNRKNWILV